MNAADVDLSLAKLTFDLKSSPTPVRIRGKKRRSRNTPLPAAIVNKSRHSVPYKPASGHVSMIEQLPFDIIELIFLYSVNVNLPRASPLIGVKLSTEHTYLQFCKHVFCASVTGDLTEIPESANDGLQKQKEMSQEHLRRAQSRDLALQCRWATWPFFISLNQHVSRQPGLWLGLLSGRIPAKLLKWPLSYDERRLLLLLASHGAKVDWINSLDGEKLLEMWKEAILAKDLQLLLCLMDRNIGVLPERSRRMWAVTSTGFDLNIIKLFKRVRSDRKNDVVDKDWPKDWPESDPKLSGLLCDKFRVERSHLTQITEAGKCSAVWKIGFTSEK